MKHQRKTCMVRQLCNQSGAFCRLGLLACLLAMTGAASVMADQPVQPSWQLGLRTSGYFYQTEDPAGAGTDRSLSYQTLSGSASGLASGRLTFRGSGRLVNGLAFDETGIEKSRLYNGHLEARLGNGLEVRLGRQFIQGGVTGLTLDGAWLSWRRSPRLEATVWGGARAPYSLAFEPGELDRDQALGGRVSLRAGRHWQVAFSGAYRERLGSIAERPVGVEVRSGSLRGARILGRAAYDLQLDRWSRVQLQTRWRASASSPVIDLQLLDRRPSIDAASWFSTFTNLERVRAVRASLRHSLPSHFGAELEYLGSFVGQRTSSRVGLAVLFPLGRVGYSVRMGDAGEENRFFGEVRHQTLPWLEIEAQAAVLTYALLENAPAGEERDLVSLAAGLRADLRPGCRVLAQVQSLDNPFYSKDVRLLLGLDLSMARGASNFGLGRGGWLQ